MIHSYYFEKFRNYLNRQHKDTENGTSISFLDFKIRRETMRNSRLHFTANRPLAEFLPCLEASSQSHINTACCLATQSIQTLLKLFHQEIDKLNTIYGYHKSFVDFCMKKYLDKVFIKKELVLKSSKDELIFVLPFSGKKSL